MNISPLKVLLSIGLIRATTLTYYALSRSTVEDLGKIKKLADSGLSEHWKNGDAILLIRHKERCDRSNNPCLGPTDGITVHGSERATEVGIRLNAYFDLDNTDVFTSPTTRTVQTSDFMLGKASLLPDREATCGSDIADKLLKYKTNNRNLIVVTHNTCMKDLVKASGDQKYRSPEYGNLLFARITADNAIQIIGKLTSEELPKQPAPNSNKKYFFKLCGQQSPTSPFQILPSSIH